MASTGMQAAAAADPWAWNRWAQTQDPGLYGWQGQRALGIDDLAALKPALVNAGKWNPEWDAAMQDPSYFGGIGQETDSGLQGGATKQLDLSSLDGYQMAEARSSGRNGLKGVFAPDGSMLYGTGETFERGGGAWKGRDYKEAAITVGGTLAAGYGIGAMAGAGAGAGATAATTGAEAAAAGTAAATNSAPIWNAALAESAVGTAGYGVSSAGLGGGAAASWGAGAGYAADAAAATSGPTAAKVGATGMGAGDWIQLANLGAGLFASKKAGDRAEAATGAMTDIAADQNALAREAQAWYQSTYDKEAPVRQAAADRQNAVSDELIAGMRFATGQSKELDAYNKSTFRPVEQQLVKDAAAYDTPERRMAAASSAAADVDMSAAATRAGNERALARTGIAPGSMRAQALAADSAVGQSSARGGAMTQAVRGVEQQGYARRADVANLGRGIATQQATQQQIATSTGGGGSSAAGQALQSATSGTPLMTQGFNTGLNGMGAAANLYGQAGRAANDETELLLRGVGGIGKFVGSRWGG